MTEGQIDDGSAPAREWAREPPGTGTVVLQPWAKVHDPELAAAMNSQPEDG